MLRKPLLVRSWPIASEYIFILVNKKKIKTMEVWGVRGISRDTSARTGEVILAVQKNQSHTGAPQST